MSTVGVHSEVGQLRQAVVHRPGPELSRLMPGNCKELLFDDVLFPAQAREEHDVCTHALRDRGVTVHHFDRLFAATLELTEARAFVLARLCTAELVGPTLAGPLRRLSEGIDGAALAELLIGGATRADLSPLHVRSLRWQTVGLDDFVLPPLPNTLFQRDNSAWIYGGVSSNPMAKAARQRASLHSRALYRFHPMFADAAFPILSGDDDLAHQPATLEGGDIHVLGRGVVLIEMGERSTAMAVEILARALFRSGQADTVITVELPQWRTFMHLETMLIMIDGDTVVRYPGLDPDALRTWVLTPTDPEKVVEQDTGGLHVERRDALFATIAAALGLDGMRVLSAEDDARAGEREQCDDANNFMTVAPGVVMGDERNTLTNSMLRDHGIDVISIPGSKLGRGRGGTRCMTCLIGRDGI